jgi:predicted ATPase
MPSQTIFLRRVVLNNFMSIARCQLDLQSLNFLVGQNGAGKSNFLDALRFTADALNTSLEHALRERGGIGEVRRRSAGHPTNFGVRLEWSLPSGDHGIYAFRIGAKPQGAFEVQHELCVGCSGSDPLAPPVKYEIRAGEIIECTLPTRPAAASDRLFLVAVSGQPEFRPLFDALLRMGFYNFNPDVIRELQSPDPGEVLASDGRNLASVLKRLADQPGGQLDRLVERLGKIVPGITGVNHKPVGKKETLEFRQRMAGSREAWRFDAENMSDGTLRALGVLVALFQPPATDGRPVRVVGIEEPETALHPGAAKVLRSALFEASRHTQIIVTSHSPDLLDDKEITPEYLISVASKDGATILGRVDEPSRSSIRDRLFTAGELLRLDQLGTDQSRFEQSTEQTSDLFAVP